MLTQVTWLSLLDSRRLLENGKSRLSEVALFFFGFALRFRFWHAAICHTSTPSEIPNFKLTHYRLLRRALRARRNRSLVSDFGCETDEE